MTNLNLKGKRILLYAPLYYSLYKEIICGLEKKGATVYFVPDKIQRFNPHYTKCFFKSLKKIYYRYINPNKLYISNFKNIFDQYWDIFICIDGYSFDKLIFDFLKKNNPDIKTVLYLWDDLSYYDYSYSFGFFDSVYSFDYLDSVTYDLKYLPLYWKQSNDQNVISEIKYDISFIGSLHSDRYDILRKIVDQCNIKGIKYYIKIIVKQRKISIWDRLKYQILKNRRDLTSSLFCQEYEIITNNRKDNLISFSPMSYNSINEIMRESRCIIDISKPGQSGLSNRVISALALRKKILSTNNSKANQYSHLNENIDLIDRKNPYLDIQFIKSKFSSSKQFDDEIQSLEIGQWINTLIE